MKTRLLGFLIVPMLLLFTANAHADAIIVGTAMSDHAGNLVLEMQVDPNADPVYVADQLKSNLELSSGEIKSVKVDDGIAQVKAAGATPKSEVQAMLSNDVALSTGVGPSPAGTEYRRRAFWLLGSAGAFAALGGDNHNPQAPLAEEPLPTPTPAPPFIPAPTPTNPPVLSPGP